MGIEELSLSVPSPLLKHFSLEWSAFPDQQSGSVTGIELIEKIGLQFGIEKEEMDGLFLGTADFSDRHAHRFSSCGTILRPGIPGLHERPVMSQVKLNADRILREVQETKELYDLMLQATERPLSEEERIKIQEQLTDIAKSIRPWLSLPSRRRNPPANPDQGPALRILPSAFRMTLRSMMDERVPLNKQPPDSGFYCNLILQLFSG